MQDWDWKWMMTYAFLTEQGEFWCMKKLELQLGHMVQREHPNMDETLNSEA